MVGGWIQLPRKLMREDKGKPKFPRFRQHDGSRRRGKRVEFIQVQKMIATFFLRHFSARHSRLFNCSKKQAAEKCGVILSQAASAQVHNKNLLLVHDATKIKRLGGCPRRDGS